MSIPRGSYVSSDNFGVFLIQVFENSGLTGGPQNFNN